MADKLGITSKFYYRSTGNFNTPTWTAIDCVSDLTVNPSGWNITEVKTRASRVVKGAKTTLPLTITGNAQVSDTDAGFLALLAASLSPTTTMDIMALDGTNATNGATGFRFEAEIGGGSEKQGPDDVLFMDFTAVPAAFSVNPVQTVAVTAGSPVFTNI